MINAYDLVVDSLAFSPDGASLASISFISDNTVRIWDWESGSNLATLDGYNGLIRDVEFNKNSNIIAFAQANSDKEVQLWDINELNLLIVFEHYASTVDFTSDTTLITTTPRGNVTLVDFVSGNTLLEAEWDVGSVDSAIISPRGELIAFGGRDGTIQLRDMATGNLLHELVGHTESVWNLTFSSDGSRLASGSDDMTARLWDVEAGQEVGIFEGHTDAIRGVEFTPDEGRIITSSLDNTMRIWNISNFTLVDVVNVEASQMVFSPDAKILAFVSESSSIRLWDFVTLKELNVLQGHTRFIENITFSPDNTLLASASTDGTIRLWGIPKD